MAALVSEDNMFSYVSLISLQCAHYSVGANAKCKREHLYGPRPSRLSETFIRTACVTQKHTLTLHLHVSAPCKSCIRQATVSAQASKSKQSLIAPRNITMFKQQLN